MTRPAPGASLAVVALLLAAATVGAATITGTAGNDTLRGSPTADRLTGKAGDDRLYGAAGNDVLVGGAGNDLLVGGPGADRLSCGTGRDTARGDARDTIAADCEVVKGVPTPPPPRPPPPPPPPYLGPITAGSYQGRTENGNLVVLTVKGRRSGHERRLPLGLLRVAGRSYVGHPSGDTGWTLNVRAAGHVTVTSASLPATRFRAIVLPPGPERDDVVRATFHQHPFPGNLFFRLAARHVRATGVFFRLEAESEA